ncbi:hypothetical protein TNCV_4002311 [Trichonephila clavipes]|uniref:Uncharacterized protein n=1 Tax=Trichonephila clavipes TaxID=2585209 RepID=A0A8X6V862_TRICX|nr:hypothetical protein TNCV_4002311 [Trichonephila clavipes]
MSYDYEMLKISRVPVDFTPERTIVDVNRYSKKRLWLPKANNAFWMKCLPHDNAHPHTTASTLELVD